jgi:hypothetical protein
LVVVLSFVVVPGFDKLQHSVLVFKCYFEICMFKDIGYFPGLGAIVCKGDLLPFVCTIVRFMASFVVLYLVLEVIYYFVREVVITGDVWYNFPFFVSIFFVQRGCDHSIDTVSIHC